VTETIAKLEQRLFDNPDDVAAHLVYADALQHRGDPRGDLIMVQHRRAGAPDDPEIAAAEAALFAAHPELAGEIAPLGTFTWRLGFIDHISMHRPLHTDIATVLGHPSCRLARSLELDVAHMEAVWAISVLGQAPRPSLRSLRLHQEHDLDDEDDSWILSVHDHHASDALWPQLQRLQKLELRAWDLFSTVYTGVKELVLADGHPFCGLPNAGPWLLPSVEKLTWHLSHDSGGHELEVEPEYLEWLWSADLPSLRHLDLSAARVTRPLLEVEPLRQLVRLLDTLWLGAGTLGETGDAVVAQLTKHHRALSHLRELAIAPPRDVGRAIEDPLRRLFPRFRWL
jgi:uncharacterized protein (TIGR02996 family)